jgi:methionyl-tRNA synthetase
MTETFIVTATPPTPNGDFHVGHLSGPYLGADIFTRYQRMRGANVLYVSSADANQSYVVTTAERKGVDPSVLATGCHREMIRTLADGRIDIDAFNEPDARHSALVQNFMRVVDQRGHVKRKIKRLPFSNAEGRFLFESFVAGYCPEWPAAGSVDTELRCLMELEVSNGETEVQPRVQA